MEWLAPVCAFWLFAALWLGGGPLRADGGGGFRQVLGLLLTGAIFVAGWAVLDLLFGVVAPPVGAAVFATAFSVLWLPVAAWIGYLLIGVRVRAVAVAAHH